MDSHDWPRTNLGADWESEFYASKRLRDRAQARVLRRMIDEGEINHPERNKILMAVTLGWMADISKTSAHRFLEGRSVSIEAAHKLSKWLKNE